MNTDKREYGSSHGGNGHADSFKSPERLEQEVNQTRARIEERLDTLTSRLSPGEMLDQALDMAREHGGEFSHNLGSQLKQNPLPLLLTSIGLSWLMMSSRNAGSAQFRAGYYDYDEQDTGPGALERVRDTMGNITERAQHLKERAHGLKERAHDVAGRAQHMGSSVGGQMRQASYSMRGRVQSTQQQLTTFFQEQPILAGSLGIAIGAALGALLPPTEAEGRLMGDESERALGKAKALAEEGYDKARDTAKEALSNVKESASSSAPSQGAGMPGYEGRSAGSSGSQGAARYGASSGGQGAGSYGASSGSAGASGSYGASGASSPSYGSPGSQSAQNYGAQSRQGERQGQQNQPGRQNQQGQQNQSGQQNQPGRQNQQGQQSQSGQQNQPGRQNQQSQQSSGAAGSQAQQGSGSQQSGGSDLPISSEN